MKNIALRAFALLILLVLFSCAKNDTQFTLAVEISEIAIKDAPAINSYAHAVYQGQWLIVGGRTDGLHDHRPDRAYPANRSNMNIWIIDPEKKTVLKKSLEGLPANLCEQLQSTNMSFYQDDNKLLLVGGYGWSDEKQNYLTFPYLTIVDVAALIEAIKSNNEIIPYFTQIENQNMAVAGGHLGKIDDEYYLVFGNRFDGRYTARHNDGHTQQYTNEIRKFKLKNNNEEFEISAYTALSDTANFHRRDYNLLPQIFPDGVFGYTAFSGVFRYNRNFPWLHPINIFAKGYKSIETFEQQFSHYHSASVAVYRQQSKQMDNLFFGGMARYFPDLQTGEIMDDPLVPFVNTISQVTRFANGAMKEAALKTKMPGLLGASANFIPHQFIPLIRNKIVDYDKLPTGRSLIGYIYGGLESTHPNIFLQPHGSSTSTNKIFEIYLIKK